MTEPLPNPSQSLWAPETIAKVEELHTRAVESACLCDDRPHDNAVHDIVVDHVPVIIARIRELEEALRRARVERNTLRGAIQGAGLGIDSDSFELTDSDGRPIGLAADTVEQLHTLLIDFSKDANVERVGLAVVRFIDDGLRIIQAYRRHRRPLLPQSKS